MDSPQNAMSALFAQLGEASDAASIARFISKHGPLPGNVRLHQAAIWSPSQADFLRDSLYDDADWAGIADRLNAELHAPHRG